MARALTRFEPYGAVARRERLRRSLSTVAPLFHMGLDTVSIAERLHMTEAEVYSTLAQRSRPQTPQRAPYAGAER